MANRIPIVILDVHTWGQIQRALRTGQQFVNMDHSASGIGQGVGITEHKFLTLFLSYFKPSLFHPSKRVDYELLVFRLHLLMASTVVLCIPVEEMILNMNQSSLNFLISL